MEEAKNSELRNKRAAVFITGGGSGFGRACAISCARMFHRNTLLVICGRNEDNLHKTKQMVREVNESVRVEILRLDLMNIRGPEVRPMLKSVFKTEEGLFECFLIIHNAGILGDASKLSYEFSDEAELESFTRVNLTGTIVLNTVLLECIKQTAGDSTAPILVVNVSSLAAVQPLVSVSIYCSVKAAREMFFRCLSTEWARFETRNLFVINYAPGPMDTDMMDQLIRDSRDSGGLAEMKTDNRLIRPQDSADKLFRDVLDRHSSFRSGSRIDYYDIP